MKRQIWRQGDIMIERVNAIPAKLKSRKRDAGRIVLAYGEVTGHAHAITAKKALAFDNGDDIYLDLMNRCLVEHEEHGAIALEPGQYVVRRQREYTPEAIIQVAD